MVERSRNSGQRKDMSVPFKKMDYLEFLNTKIEIAPESGFEIELGKINKNFKYMRIDAAISKVLADNNAKHADLLSGKFDREKLIVAEDGTVSGLDEQMKGLKESYKDLFGATVSGRTPANPEGRNNVPTFEALVNNADTMTAEEVAAQFAALEK